MNAETPASAFEMPPRQRGRKPGARNKFSQAFFEDFHTAWEQVGLSAMLRCAFHRPDAFVGIAARLMPQKLEIANITDDMSDDVLAKMLELAERMTALAEPQMQPARLIHKYPEIDNSIDARGQGRDAVVSCGEENISATLRDGRGDHNTEEHNKLFDLSAGAAPQSGATKKPESGNDQEGVDPESLF